MTSPAELTEDPRICAALRGELPIDDLDESEQELFYDLIAFADPTPSASSRLSARRKRGGGVGYDKHGRLVRGLPKGGVEVLRDSGSKLEEPEAKRSGSE